MRVGLVSAALVAALAGGLFYALRPVTLSPQVRQIQAAAKADLQTQSVQPQPLQTVQPRRTEGASSFPMGVGRIAIVLDDWGYSHHHLAWLETLDRPLTIAVLPNLPYSEEVAKAAHRHGHEVILHMPMEAMSPLASQEPATLLTSMSQKEMLDRLERSLTSVPFARGISNHQGSKATADRGFMRLVLDEVKRRDLYFLDSLVTDRSVAEELAGNVQLPFARRTVFLDHENDPAQIRAQLVRLAEEAARQGHAIGIGHDRPQTVQLLQEAIPALEQAGYTMVPVSELVETEGE